MRPRPSGRKRERTSSAGERPAPSCRRRTLDHVQHGPRRPVLAPRPVVLPPLLPLVAHGPPVAAPGAARPRLVDRLLDVLDVTLEEGRTHVRAHELARRRPGAVAEEVARRRGRLAQGVAEGVRIVVVVDCGRRGVGHAACEREGERDKDAQESWPVWASSASASARRMTGSARKPAMKDVKSMMRMARKKVVSAWVLHQRTALPRRTERVGRTPSAEQLGERRLAEAVPCAALTALVEAVELVGFAPRAQAVLMNVAGLLTVRNVSSRIATRRRCGGRTVPRQRQGASSRPRSSSSSSSPKQIRHTWRSSEVVGISEAGEGEGASRAALSRIAGPG